MRYAVLSQDGELVDVQSTQAAAVSRASEIAPRVQIEGGSESRHLSGYGDFGATDPVKLPELALASCGVPRMDIDHVMRMSIEEAHARLLKFFPKTRTRKSGQVVPVRSYETPTKMVAKLLGQNYKTAKETPEAPTKVMGLSLLPYDMGKTTSLRTLPMKRGLGFCFGSSEACRAACLVYSGHNVIDIYNQIVKNARTEAVSLEPHAFARVLVAALKRHFEPRNGAPDYEPLVRLNVFSDLPWELILPGAFEMFSGSQFYDYTKVPGRVTPENYDLTFSWSGTPANREYVYYELERGRRIAVVFLLPGKSKVARREADLPSRFLDLPVVDGDISDVRPRDPAPGVVGLRWKPHGLGKNVNLEENKAFIVPCEEVDGVLVAAESSRMSPIADPDEDEDSDSPNDDAFYRRGQTGVEDY